MPAYPLSDLILPSLVILVAGFVISLAFTRRPVLSCSIAALKAGLFLLYFSVFFDGSYTFLDDWRYLRVGELLAQQHIGIINFIHNYQYVLSTVESVNLSYYIYNASSIDLFGPGYYAPVAMNILLTFIAAGLLTRTARIGLGMSRRTSMGLFAFLALAPSILAWSTITNMKDILVATGTATVVYAVALLDSGKPWRALLIAAAGAAVLMVTRFYVPLTLAAAFGASLLFSARARRSPWLWLTATVALVGVLHMLGHGSLTGALHKLRGGAGNPVAGIVRFVMTPIPFHTAPGYGFLDLPQLIYWLLLPFEAYGMVAVWKKRTLTGHFLVVYFLIMTVLYGVQTSLQGPRHRIQIDGLIVIFQYHGILALFRQQFRATARARPAFPASRRHHAHHGGPVRGGAVPQPGRGT